MASHSCTPDVQRTHQHSIRVNDPFRLCFVWTAEGAANVECVDYH